MHHPKLAGTVHSIPGSNVAKLPLRKILRAAGKQANLGLQLVCRSEPLGKSQAQNLSGAQPNALNAERDVKASAVSRTTSFAFLPVQGD